ncbi:MAG: DUF1080 domain-containing protein [Sphingobium sp.]|nr:DUF1080 domain-containing protein [Sphingobium sp.]
MIRSISRAGASALALGGLAFAVIPPAAAQTDKAPAGFVSLFDGKTLKGWRGDMTVWSVKDGAIQGGSPTPIPHNTFLVGEKNYANFELRFKYRWLTPEGNSGMQFRSAQTEGPYAMTGYQANVVPTNAPPERFGMLYNELGDRQEMALLGQKATITRRPAGAGGRGRVVRTVSEMVNSREAIIGSIKPAPEWTEVVVIAYGNHIVAAINGLLAFDAIDNDPVRMKDGVFGIQAHSGPAMIVQYKDIYVKPLTAAPNLAGRFRTNPTPAPEPRQTFKDSTKAAMPDEALPKE